jgi:methyl-accepting chemotaxis protein
MIKDYSLKAKVGIVVTISILVVATISTIVAITDLNLVSEKSQKRFEEIVIKKRKAELQGYTYLGQEILQTYQKESTPQAIEKKLQKEINLIISIMENEYQAHGDKVSAQEMKSRLKNIISSARYGKNSYFWAHDLDGHMVTHPIKPSLNGKQMIETKDTNGVYLFKKMNSVANSQGEGLVSYQWTKPDTKKAEDKISYVKLFKPYGWVIGTGVYTKDIKAQVMAKSFDIIKQTKYSEDGYFWILDTDGNMLMHKEDSLIGKSFQDITQIKDGTKVDSMLSQAKANTEAFIEYTWKKDIDSKECKKLSHVRYFKDWNIIIGTGCYLDDLAKEVECMKKESQENIFDVALSLSLITLVMIAIILVIIILIMNSVIKPIMVSVADLLSSSTSVASASEQFSVSSGTLADSSVAQSANIEQISATVEEFKSSISSNQQSLDQAHDLSMMTNSIAVEGFDDVKALISSMDGVNRSSNQIANIIQTIDEIAFQTNLLALNAAVEAARAGEHGLGFAVVAEEVRALAGRSADAAGETATIIEQSIQEVKEINHISQNTNESFSKILISAKELNAIIENITVSAKEQTESITQISDSMCNIDLSTQKVASSSQELASGSEELNQLAQSMQTNTDQIARLIRGKSS